MIQLDRLLDAHGKTCAIIKARFNNMTTLEVQAMGTEIVKVIVKALEGPDGMGETSIEEL